MRHLRLLLHLELSYEALGSRGSALSQPDLCTGWRVQRSQLSPVYLFPYLVQPKNEEDPVCLLFLQKERMLIILFWGMYRGGGVGPVLDLLPPLHSERAWLATAF